MAIANSAGGQMDDDLDGDLDIDPDAITEVDVARQKIKQLMHEQERAADYEDRLTRKLQRLDADLAAKREQVEGLQRSLNLERNKFAEEYKSEKRERETKAKTQEERIREYLTEVLYTKPKQKDKRGEFNLDTVLVSFVKPNESFRYNLAFRVDSGTTVAQLRNSACKYWGVSSEHFILRTMANNKCQDDNNVKDCFKQGEIAQLRLEMKRENAEPPSEEELKAIQPKSKKRAGNRSKGGKPRYNAEGVEQIQKFGENYANQLKKMGGVYFLLKLRDSKPSEHAGKINLRNILIYTTLVILSAYVYTMRRPVGEAYWCAKGVQDFFLLSTPRDAQYPGDGGVPVAYGNCTGAAALDHKRCVPSFQDVQTMEQMWDWLNFTVPDIFWVEDSPTPMLNTYNQLLGYFSVRVQNVKDPTSPTEFCVNNAKLVSDFNILNLAEDPNNLTVSCYPRHLSESTRRTDPYVELSDYWRNQTMSSQGDSLAVVRGLSDPGVFRSDEENRDKHGITSMDGLVSSYDASGYSVDYRMQVSDPDESIRAQYREDLQVLRDIGWIGTATRVVIISFSTYNYDYDVWTASDFMFEMPPDGDVLPSFLVQPFKPRIYETRDELSFTYIDYVRLAIAIYILIFVGWAERQHKVRNHKAGFYYHISLSGITDLGLVICIFVTLVWHTVVFHDPPTATYIQIANDADRTRGFQSFRNLAGQYNTVFILDGIVMVFLMFRMVTFFRLSHTVYLQWKAIGQALKAFIFFTLIFVPAIAGFVVVSTALFGKYIYGFSSLMRTSVSTFKLTHGDLNPRVLDRDIVVGVISGMALYLLLTFFLMNVFITIFVDAYYVIRLTCTQPAEKWDGQKIRTWALPGVCVSMFQAVWSRNTAEGRD